MKKLIIFIMLLGLPAMADTNLVWYDGTHLGIYGSTNPIISVVLDVLGMVTNHGTNYTLDLNGSSSVDSPGTTNSPVPLWYLVNYEITAENITNWQSARIDGNINMSGYSISNVDIVATQLTIGGIKPVIVFSNTTSTVGVGSLVNGILSIGTNLPITSSISTIYTNIDTSLSNCFLTLPSPSGGTNWYVYKASVSNTLSVIYGSSTSQVSGLTMIDCFPTTSTNWVIRW